MDSLPLSLSLFVIMLILIAAIIGVGVGDLIGFAIGSPFNIILLGGIVGAIIGCMMLFVIAKKIIKQLSDKKYWDEWYEKDPTYGK